MPTMFGRRYYRKLEEVGRTEVLLGLVLLLLAAGIVAGYAVQSSTDRSYLFAVADSDLDGDSMPHEMAVAAQMLPRLGNASWQAVGEPEALPCTELAAEHGEAAAVFSAFAVQWVYRQRYAAAQRAGEELTVLVADAALPELAFGLWHARRPDEAADLGVGRGGWLSDVRAGFWNGRYYTELRADAPLSGKTLTLPAAARAIASVQLPYGGPFWADSILPAENRVADSFRYVHRAALGIELLNEAFLADYRGGLTRWVTDAGSDSAAQALLDDLKGHVQPAPAEGGDFGYGEPSHSEPATPRYLGPLTVLPFNDGEMAVFTAGRYVYGTIGGDPDAVVAAAKNDHAVASPVGASAGVTVAQAPSGTDEPVFPESRSPDWRVPLNVARFTPDNLYVKINGRADAYLQFNVVDLTFGTYSHAADRERTIDVYWYDMGKSENALGIYQAEASGGAEAVAVGREGYQVGGAVFFRKGGSYVQILPAGDTEEDASAALEIAQRIDERIGDAGDDDAWATNVLPQAGRVQGSLAYLAQDAFSLDFLGDVFTAEYDVDGVRLTLFIHRAEDAATAEALFERYLGFFRDYGRILWEEPDTSRRIAAGDVAGLVDVVFVTDRYLGGVAGADDPEAAKSAATSFCRGLAGQ